jgi:hypothetical protein
LNYVAKKLNDNRRKFLADARDLYKRLVGATKINLAFIELLVVDWADKLLGK